MLSNQINQPSRLKEYLVVSILLIILVIGFLWQIFFLGEAFLPADLVNTSVHPWALSEQNEYEIGQRPYNPTLSDPIYIYYPMKHYLKASFDEGIVPMWNPSAFGGYPYNSRVISGIIYPLDFIFLFIPMVYSFGFGIAFHLFAAGMFVYVLCKTLGISRLGSFFGAVIFMFNANTVLWLQFPNHLKGELWIPIIFLFLIRFYREKRIIFPVLSGIFLGLQVIAGFAQAVQFTAIAIAVLLLIHTVYDLKDKKYSDIGKNIGGTVLAGVIGLGIGLCFILPFYKELGGSLRAVQERGAGGNMNFRYLVTMLNPNFFGNGIKGAFWLPGTNYIEAVRYSGVATLFLGAVAVVFKRGKAVFSFLAVAVVAVLLNSVPQIFNFFNKIIPFFDKSSISRILLLVPFCLAVLSAYGLSCLGKMDFKKQPGRAKKAALLVIVLALAFLFLIMGLSYAFDANISIRNLHQNQQIRLETLSLIMFCAMVAATAAFLLLALKTGYKKIFLFLLVPLIVLDLFMFGINFNTTSDPDQVFFETEGIEYMKQDEEKGRVLGVMGGTFNPNSMWVVGLEDTGGYDPFIPWDYARFWAAFQGGDRVRPNGKVGADRMYANFLKLTNTRYVASYAFMQEMGYFFNNMDKNLNEVSSKESRLTTWNFMEHIIPTIEVAPDSVMEFDYSIPPSSELVFYSALHPGSWNEETGDGVLYRVYVQWDGQKDLVFEQDINPIENEEERRWYMHRVDLSDYGDMQARIVFETDSKQNTENDAPGWGNPRIIPLDSLGHGELMLGYNKEVKIYNNQMYLPRAFLAGTSMAFEESGHILAYLAGNRELDLDNTVLLQDDAPRIEGVCRGSADIVDYSNNRVEIEVENEIPAYLVLLDRYDEDWNAYIDGKKAEIFRANYLFRAVYLEPGSHTVEFRYRPVWFFVSTGISIFVLIISVAGCIVIYKSGKKGKNAGDKK
ncbi:MAG: YfhO family protein [Actinomycetota bacterium]